MADHKIVERVIVTRDGSEWGPAIRIDWRCACSFSSAVHWRSGHNYATMGRVDGAFRRHAKARS